MPSVGLPHSMLEAAELIRERRVSPTELAREVLSRTEALQPHLDAFIRAQQGAQTTAQGWCWGKDGEANHR